MGEKAKLRLPTPNPVSGVYRFDNGAIIQPAYNVPGKWVAFWPGNGSVPLRGDNDKKSYFDSPEEVLAIFIEAGY